MTGMSSKLIHIPHTDNLWVDPAEIKAIWKQPREIDESVYVVFYLYGPAEHDRVSYGDVTIGARFFDSATADEAIAAVTPQATA